MGSSKKLFRITGWVVFAIALTVYFFSAERTGSLWDCGEFILGAYKLQVVHPPGAPLFLLIGRIFAWVGSIFSDDPANIAFAVNMMSSTCTAFAAAFIAWVTMDLTKANFCRTGRRARQWPIIGDGWCWSNRWLNNGFLYFHLVLCSGRGGICHVNFLYNPYALVYGQMV